MKIPKIIRITGMIFKNLLHLKSLKDPYPAFFLFPLKKDTELGR